MIRDLALLAARLAIGGGIAAHGAQKAFGSFEGPGPAGAAGLMDSLGFRPGPTFATAASSTEIAAGALIALGLGGPIGPALLGSTMIVAGSSVHWKNGFFAQKNGIELSTLYAAAGLAFAGGGYGALSLDCCARHRRAALADIHGSCLERGYPRCNRDAGRADRRCGTARSLTRPTRTRCRIAVETRHKRKTASLVRGAVFLVSSVASATSGMYRYELRDWKQSRQ